MNIDGLGSTNKCFENTYCLNNELYILYYRGTNSQVPALVSDYYFLPEPVSGRLLFCMQQNNIQQIPSLNGTEYSKTD